MYVVVFVVSGTDGHFDAILLEQPLSQLMYNGPAAPFVCRSHWLVYSQMEPPTAHARSNLLPLLQVLHRVLYQQESCELDPFLTLRRCAPL